jgi:hypothetical protein
VDVVSDLVTPTRSASPAERRHVAERWAPTIYQETRDSRDYLTAFDYDGDWDGANNALHLDRFPLRANVYYTVDETPTHFLIAYVLYHPVDAKVPYGHDHDTEHVTLAVRKSTGPAEPDGRVEVMEVRFHHSLYQYAADGAGVRDGADDIDGPIHFAKDGRPEVYVQRVGHGICGGFSPPTWFEALSLACHHGETPHFERNGVVYHYTGRAEVPSSPDDRDVGYALQEIGDTLWAHVHDTGPHATFAAAFDYHGERCGLFRCPRQIGGELASAEGHSSTGLPWEESSGTSYRGEHFLDPALTFSRRLRFPAPFSTSYVFNPYLGVGEFPSAPRGDTVAGQP